MGSNPSALADDDDFMDEPQSSRKEKSGASKKGKEGSLPDVNPPSVLKKELLKDIDFTVIDNHAMKAPNTLLKKSFWDLAKYLSDDGAWDDDLVKVRVIFRWITSYRINKIKIEDTPPPNTPLEYFSKIQCDMGNHAYLFYILCQLLDIPCVVIDGMTKSKVYKVGENVDREEMAAQWNAVYIKEEWRLIDVFWAITCVDVDSGKDDLYDENGDFIDNQSKFSESVTNLTASKASLAHYQHAEECDEQYFLTDPRQLIWTHFPDETKWQLMNTPMSEKDWNDQLYVRERSHEMDIKIRRKTYGKCIVDAKDGKTDIILWLPQERGENYDFKHAFRRHKMDDGEKRPIDRILNRFTIFEHVHDRIHFKSMLPVSGIYRLDMYGREPHNPELKEFDLLCSYIIVSTIPDKEPEPLPDYPRIGWGPCTRSMKLNLIPRTHKEAYITTDDGILEIMLEGSAKLKLQIKLKSPIIDDANLSKYAMLRWHAGEYIIQTRLPKPGKYALKLYAVMDSNSFELVNVLNYLITCTGHGVKNFPFPTLAQEHLGEDPSAYKIWVRGFQYETSFIEARESHTKLEFEAKDGIGLSCELNSNNPEAAERMRVVNKEERNHQCYYLDLPVEGEYSFNLFAYKKTGGIQKLHNAFSYLIHSPGRYIEKGQTNTTKGNANRNFWKDCNEITTETIETKQDEINIPVPRCVENLVAFLRHKNSNEPPSSKHIQRVTERDIEIYKIKLPEIGEYLLNIYEKKEIGFLKSKARYLIRKIEVDEEERDHQDFLEVLEIIRAERKKEGKDVSQADKLKKQLMSKETFGQPSVDERIALTQQLKEAINNGKPSQIRKALNDYKFIKPAQNDDLLVEGTKLLRKLEAKEELVRAYSEQNLENLEKAIVKVKATDDGSMKQELVLASRMRDRLAAQSNLRDMVLNTDIKTIQELRKLVNPPDGVHQAIKAALILLDHPRTEVEDWKKCLALLGKRSQDGLRYRMADLDPADIKRKNALDAKLIIEPYTAERLRYISPGAAAFYIWDDHMIKQVESSIGMLKKKEPPKPPTPKPPTPPPPQPKKRKEPTRKYVTLDTLFKEKIPIESPSKPKPESKENNEEKKDRDTPASESKTYVVKFHERNNYMAKKERFQRVRPLSDTPFSKSKEFEDARRNVPKSLSPDMKRKADDKENRHQGKNPKQKLDSKKGLENQDKKQKPETKNAPGSNENSNDPKSTKNKIPQSEKKDVEKNKDEKSNNLNTNNDRKNENQSKEKDIVGYYNSYKADKISNQKPPPDILQINHDTDPVDDPTEKTEPGGYKSLYQRRKHYKDFKTLPKQTV